MRTAQQPPKENLLVNLCFNIIIPAIILSKLSKPEYLGPFYGLVIALLFPLSYGLYDFVKRKKANAISILGFVSILLTGIIGLMQFPPEWIAVKEASIPFIIGIIVLVSIKTPYPLVKTFIYNEQILDVKQIDAILAEKNKRPGLERLLKLSSVFLSLSFFLSAVLNFVLAKIIVKSAPGTVAFNEELGRMTVLSYPVIALPSTIILMFILWYIIRSIRKLTGISNDNIYAEHLRETLKDNDKKENNE